MPIFIISNTEGCSNESTKLLINAIPDGVVNSSEGRFFPQDKAILLLLAISKTVGTGTDRKPCEVFTRPEPAGGNRVRQEVVLRKGLSQEVSKKLSKLIRDNIKKVTVSIQGDSLRITGKNKDDLQSAINLIKKQEDELDVALQFENYR